MKKDITETTVIKGKIVESDRSKLPEGVLARVSYPVCNIGQLNANKRVYERGVWDRVLENQNVQEKMSNRCLYGQAEHPSTAQSDLTLTSHVVTETWIDEENIVHQNFDILDTPTGRIIETLLRAGCNVGVSTRAEGELEEANDSKLGKHYRVVPESYEYITTDFTADPSTFNMAIESVEMRESACKSIQSVIESDAQDHEKKFATMILESIKVNEEEVSEEMVEVDKEISALTKKLEGLRLKGRDRYRGGEYDEVLNQLLTKTRQRLGESNVVVSTPSAVSVSVDDADEVEVTPDGTVKVETDSEDGEMEVDVDMEEEIPMEIPESPTEDLEGPVEDKEEEAGPFEKIQKELTDLKVAEASVRAERDKVNEEYENLVSEMNSSNLSNSLLKSKIVVMKEQRTKLSDSINSLNKKIKNYESVISESEQLLENIEKQIEKRESDFQKQLEEATNKTKEEALKEAEDKFIASYAKHKVEESGITLQENSKALLESCKTIAEVDQIFEQLIHVLREDALHSNADKKIRVVETIHETSDQSFRSGLKKQIGGLIKGM